MDFHPPKGDCFIIYFHEPRDTWELDHRWVINSCLKRMLLSWGTRLSWKSANKITWSKIISRFPTHFPGTWTHENAGNITKISHCKTSKSLLKAYRTTSGEPRSEDERHLQDLPDGMTSGKWSWSYQVMNHPVGICQFFFIMPVSGDGDTRLRNVITLF